MIQLYDVAVRFRQKPGTPCFMMRATLLTLARLLDLHKDAVFRIERETATGGIAEIFHSRGQFFDEVHLVMQARGDLSERCPNLYITELQESK